MLELKEALINFSKIKVLVIGDVMLDRYLWGNVKRISPEAPVPIVNLTGENIVVGGAANVAANIVGLGAEAYLLGLVGEDAESETLRNALLELSISPENLISVNDRPTTVKTRVIAHNQQVVRIDSEKSVAICVEDENKVIESLARLIETTDIIIISDYGKGLLSPKILRSIISIADNFKKQVLIDPKGNDFTKYSGAYLLTPNKKEALDVVTLNRVNSDIYEVGRNLIDQLSLKALLITCGEDGMTIFEKDLSPVDLSAVARRVYDVTGAGDTVIAVLAVSLAAKLNLLESARLANLAAGIVVEEVGTTAIKFESLRAVLGNSK